MENNWMKIKNIFNLVFNLSKDNYIKNFKKLFLNKKSKL